MHLLLLSGFHVGLTKKHDPISILLNNKGYVKEKRDQESDAIIVFFKYKLKKGKRFHETVL